MNARPDSSPPESLRRQLLWLGFLGLVVLWFFSLIVHGPVIERSLGQEIRSRLAAAGFLRLEVEVQGRDVTLLGEVSGAAALGVGMALARDVDGVRVVHDRTRQVAASLPWLRFTRDADKHWRVTGVLPVADSWENLTKLLGQQLTDRHAVYPQTDPEAGDPPWIDAIGELLAQVSDLDHGRLEIGAGFIEVGGLMTDVARHSVLEKSLNQLAGTAEMALVNRIALLPRRAIQPTEKSAN